MDINEVAAAKAAMLKARKKAKKAADAQYKLNQLHRDLADSLMKATKYYESVSNAYLDSKLKEAGYD